MTNLFLGFLVISFCLLGNLIHAADGSIHDYNNSGGFTKIANARYFVGGSEFLDVHHASSDTPLLKGNSFIRYAFRFLF